MSAVRAALISGSLNLAPGGISSSLATGLSGEAGGSAIPFVLEFF